MEGLIMAAQIILSLSILVGLHEMGHLLAAKAFGMRVEQFSIGFPPKIWGFKYGETEYSLSAIPLGGFVKISGMIDESMDKEQMAQPPKEYEFRSKPAWQRLIVMLGGIVVNVVTGIIIFICLNMVYGEEFISKDDVNAKGGIMALDLAEDIGLQSGDKIIKINGKDYSDFKEIMSTDLFLGDGSYYTVLRDGEEVNVQIPGNFIEKLNDTEAAGQFIMPRLPSTIGAVAPNSLAEKLGLQEGDKLISVAGKNVNYHDEVVEVVKNYKNDTLAFQIQRGDDVMSFNEYFANDSIIGYAPLINLETSHIDYGFGEAVSKGTTEAFSVVFTQIKAFGKMFSGELNPMKSLAGPIGIAQAYGGEWQWQRFWNLTGLLSMILAFMNLLPIPALDGGHVLFLTYEMVSGRKPSDKFLEYAQKAGMVFLLALMVFIVGNDIFKLIF